MRKKDVVELFNGLGKRIDSLYMHTLNTDSMAGSPSNSLQAQIIEQRQEIFELQRDLKMLMEHFGVEIVDKPKERILQERKDA